MRTADLPDWLATMTMPAIEPARPLPPQDPRHARIALISTGGLFVAGDRPFDPGATDYRVIPGDVAQADLRMSHVSVNFDRSGFQLDLNTVFPIDRLRELHEAGEVGAVAAFHYAFMGATEPDKLHDAAREVARHLHADNVTAVVLLPT